MIHISISYKMITTCSNYFTTCHRAEIVRIRLIHMDIVKPHGNSAGPHWPSFTSTKIDTKPVCKFARTRCEINPDGVWQVHTDSIPAHTESTRPNGHIKYHITIRLWISYSNGDISTYKDSRLWSMSAQIEVKHVDKHNCINVGSPYSLRNRAARRIFSKHLALVLV